MSSRSRCGSSSGASAGTTAMPPGGSADDRLGVRLGDPLDGADELEVLRADRRHDDDVGPGDRAELGDLPEPAHAHLGDEDLRLRLEPADRQRQADLVVLARGRPDRRHRRAAEGTEDVLRRGLARGADDGDDTRVALRADERAQSARAPLPGRRGTSVAAPRAAASATCSTPVLRATKRSPGPDDARVGLDAGDLPRRRVRRRRLERSEIERLDLVPGDRDHRALPRVASRAEPRLAQRLAHDDAIVERRHHARGLLALLVPLAGDHDDVVRRRRAPPRDGWQSAGPDRSRRRSRPPGGRPG